jgi:hypothetical protein
MAESLEATVAKPAPEPSFWEDLVDIFYAPVGVYQRWAKKSFWPPLLFVVIATAIISFFTFHTLAPAIEADMDRAFAQQMAKSGQTPTAAQQEAMGKMQDRIATFGRYATAVPLFFFILLLGFGVWILGKAPGINAQQTFGAAMVVASWAYMPRVLGAVLGGVQGLLMDVSSMNTIQALSIGPVRFFDPDTTNPLLYQLLTRLDLITIWVTVLLAIGVYVTGKTTKGGAAAFGFLIWFVGSLWALRTGFLAM